MRFPSWLYEAFAKVFLGCAIAALIAQEPALALACCAMSGVLKIESEKE